jgi:hypothetical protein
MDAGKLIAILASPPTTSGERTRLRVEKASIYLGCSGTSIVNLFPLPTYRTGDISRLGENVRDWLDARAPIERELRNASAVLLAYGLDKPSGPARSHHRDQTQWLESILVRTGLPLYQVGNGPRHPSRWQRWTNSAHPGIPFPLALKASLSRVLLPNPAGEQVIFD